MKEQKKIQVLVDLHAITGGYAGIPQESRLLFYLLKKMEQIETIGILHHKNTNFPQNGKAKIISSSINKGLQLPRFFLKFIWVYTKSHFNFGKIKLNDLNTSQLPDSFWEKLFIKTIELNSLHLMKAGDYRICPFPLYASHILGLFSFFGGKYRKYPKWDTDGSQFIIAQTPFPVKVSSGTQLIVRYHDAIPILLPHTVRYSHMHALMHYFVLKQNVSAGAWFVCVSETTRKDLNQLFPETINRSTVIHNMIGSQYYFEESSKTTAWSIIFQKSHEIDVLYKLKPKFIASQESRVQTIRDTNTQYLLMVSTFEPRKNHQRLLKAWEKIRSETNQNIKLIFVGSIGWRYKTLFSMLKPWVDRQEVFILTDVPPNELRVLYRHAAATICPSMYEGFDFSGIESIACGGITIASDIPVHREIYQQAALYYDTEDTMALTKVIEQLLFSGENSTKLQESLYSLGLDVAKQYTEHYIAPQWQNFFLMLEENTSK